MGEPIFSQPAAWRRCYPSLETEASALASAWVSEADTHNAETDAAGGHVLQLTNSAAPIGLAAGVGPDVPPAITQWLEEMGIDTTGLLHTAHPTPRAWQVRCVAPSSLSLVCGPLCRRLTRDEARPLQLLEEDGLRTQVWRCEASDELYGMLRPDLDQLPPAYRCASTPSPRPPNISNTTVART